MSTSRTLKELDVKNDNDSISATPITRVNLNSTILSADKKNHAVYAEYCIDEKDYFAYLHGKKTVKYFIFLKLEKTGDCVGLMTIMPITADSQYKPSFIELSQLYYTEDQGKLSHVHILVMRNVSGPDGYSHVGNALHECAFRLSIAFGCHGRIILQAIAETHYFYNKNNFKALPLPKNILYYADLAIAIHRAGNKRITESSDDKWLYLSRDAILENLKKFAITHTLPEFNTESIDPFLIVSRNKFELIVNEALKENATLTIKVMTALKARHGSKNDMEMYQKSRCNTSYSKDYEKYVKNSPSINCVTTKKLLDNCIEMISLELPIDSKEKELTFAKILVGTMICVMTHQDKKYGAQAKYGHKLLCPDNAYHLIWRDPNITCENILIVGTRAIVDKTLSYDGEINSDLFYSLSILPELKAFLHAVTTEKNDCNEVEVSKLRLS